MNGRALLLAVVPLLFSVSSCSGGTKKDCDVIIMGGQSNMVGCSKSTYLGSTMGSAKYAEYQAGYQSIKISYNCWTKNGTDDYQLQNHSNDKFVNVMLGEGNSDITFGPEVGIAETLSEKGYDDNVFLIKYACGAANLLDDFASPGSGKKTKMYSGFVEYVRGQLSGLKEQGYNPTIKAFLWMQGEGDSYPGYADQYYDQESYLVDDIRKEFLTESGGTDMAFVDGGISNSPVWSLYETINSAKEQLSNQREDNIYIDTIKEGLDYSREPTGDPDLCHYDSSSMVKLGRLFASAVLPYLSPVTNGE